MKTKNELRRRLKEKLRNRDINVVTYDFEDDEERELQALQPPTVLK